ncbi:Hypothetical protein R9X50_00184700 [Acrodontium crateriforme]|uniref:Uncharacterized protein n=1 Tax=Acrodontium crateriforme TaxID=150365 RepID=A0AAQ3M0E9_9PEZI|nr:Hypothetical protein R9X50_00184700 [Acrodontium crateriforme]
MDYIARFTEMDFSTRQEIVDRFGPLAFPMYYGGRFLHVWSSNIRIQLPASIIGNLIILYTLAQFGLFIWGYFLRPSRLPVYCHAETGSWVLVTGASDGIGRGFADEFVARGFNVLLHGRNPEKLAKVKREINLRWPKRQVEFVVADASSGDHPEDAVIEKVKQLPGKLTVLVNNVGGITTKPIYVPLSETTSEAVETCINVNARFPIQLTRGLLPMLQDNTPSLIINCSSTAGVHGVPYIAAYAGTKGFLNSLSQSLHTELKRSSLKAEVEVISFVIGNVISANNKSDVPFVTMSSAECAKGCLARVGCGEVVTFAHWKHFLTVQGMFLLPEKYRRTVLLSETEQRVADEKKRL